MSMELRATKCLEESVKSEPEQQQEQKHDEDSYEEDKRDFTKEEEEEEEEEEEKYELKPEEVDSDYSDYEEYWSKYENDDSQPFMYKRRSDGCVFKNKAWLDGEAKIREYRELSRDLSVYDAIPCPPGLGGGIAPLYLSDKVLSTLENLCNVALKIYNNKQGPTSTFVFHKVVKCTHPAGTSLTGGMQYYITFQATEKGKPDLTTFQTHVVQDGDEVDVKEFVIKT